MTGFAAMQISADQLRAYIDFQGDRDGLARSGLPGERLRALDAAWPVLDQLRLDLFNLKHGRLSFEAAGRAERQARASLPDDAAYRRFLDFA